MKFNCVSCFVFGLLCFVCYGHIINEIQNNKSVKHISTKVYNPSKEMFSKYLSMNPPRFPPTFIHTRVRVPFNGKPKKLNWKPPTLVVRTNKVGGLINKHKQVPNNKMHWKTPQNTPPTTRRINQGMGVPGRNPVIRKIIQKRKMKIPINKPVLRHIIPPNMNHTVRIVHNPPKGISSFYTTTFKPQNPLSVDLTKTGDFVIPFKPSIFVEEPPAHVSKVDVPTSEPPIFVPVPILHEINVHTTPPSFEIPTKRQFIIDKITPIHTIQVTSRNIPMKSTPRPNLVWKIPMERPQVQRTTIPPSPPRMFTRQPTVRQRLFSPIVFIRPKQKRKPTTLKPRTTTIMKTTLPPIIIPPIRSAFEEVQMPPSLIDRGVKKIAILKTTSKPPIEKNVSQTKSSVTTYRPLTSTDKFIPSSKGWTPVNSKGVYTTKPTTTQIAWSSTEPTTAKTTTEMVSETTLPYLPKTNIMVPRIVPAITTYRPTTTVTPKTTERPFVIKSDSTLPMDGDKRNEGDTTTFQSFSKMTTTLPKIQVQTQEPRTRPALQSTVRPIVKSTGGSFNHFPSASTITTDIPHTTLIPNSSTSTDDMRSFSFSTIPTMKVTTEGSGDPFITTSRETPVTDTIRYIFRYVSPTTKTTSTGYSDINTGKPSMRETMTVTPDTTRMEEMTSKMRGDNIPTTTEQFHIEHKQHVTGIPLSLDMIGVTTPEIIPETKTIKGVFVHIPQSTPENNHDYIRYRIVTQDESTTTTTTEPTTTTTTEPSTITTTERTTTTTEPTTTTTTEPTTTTTTEPITTTTKPTTTTTTTERTTTTTEPTTTTTTEPTTTTTTEPTTTTTTEPTTTTTTERTTTTTEPTTTTTTEPTTTTTTEPSTITTTERTTTTTEPTTTTTTEPTTTTTTEPTTTTTTEPTTTTTTEREPEPTTTTTEREPEPTTTTTTEPTTTTTTERTTTTTERTTTTTEPTTTTTTEPKTTTTKRTTTTKPTTTTTEPTTKTTKRTTTEPTTTTATTTRNTVPTTTPLTPSTSTTPSITNSNEFASTKPILTTEWMSTSSSKSTTIRYDFFGGTSSETRSTEPTATSNDTETNVDTTNAESISTTTDIVPLKISTTAVVSGTNVDVSTVDANDTDSGVKTTTTASSLNKGCVHVGCPRGRQCVTKDNSICSLQNGLENCFCKPGCVFENMYVGLGQPIVTDRCGNLCYCGTSGLTACTKIPCDRNKYEISTPSPFKPVEFKPDVKDRGPTRGDSPYFYYDNTKSKSVRVHGLHFPEQLVAWLSPFSPEFRDRLPMTGIKEIPIGSLFKT